jgi:hypothetical protein
MITPLCVAIANWVLSHTGVQSKAALRASAIGLPITLRDRFGRTQTHQAAAGDREDGYLAFVTRYLGPQRQCTTSLNTAAAGG